MDTPVHLLKAVHLAAVITANLINLLLAGMFLARAGGLTQLARGLGTVVVVLGIPMAVAAVINLLWRQDLWLAILPGLVVLYCGVELLLDYVLKIDFRSTAWLWPYLALYYVGLMGMVGYAFMVSKPLGFATLVTYFVQLAATFYSFAHVGHAT